MAPMTRAEGASLGLFPCLMLAFANLVDGVRDVFFHPAVLVFAGGGDGFIHLMDRFDALAAFVVPGFFEMVFRFLKMLDGVLGISGLLELLDGFVHLRLRSVMSHGKGVEAR